MSDIDNPPGPQPAAALPSSPETAAARTAVPAAMAAEPHERLYAALWIGMAAGTAFVTLYLLAAILAPFALAAVLAYLLLPGANWLHRRRLPRALACLLMVLLSLALGLGLLLTLVPVLEREALALNDRLPGLIALLNQRVVPLLQQWTGAQLHFDPALLRTMALQHVGQQDVAQSLLAHFSSGSVAVLGLVGSATLIPVVLFYLLLDAAAFARRLEASIPRRWYAPTMSCIHEIDLVLSQFLRGQLTVMLLLAIYYSGALTLAGFESALPIGVLTGLLVFIPYVGFALGFVLAALVALLQFASWQAVLILVAIYGVGNCVESFLLTPRLVGERIGLHPLAVIFALLAFGHLFGFLGVLVALPASAVLLVALRRVRVRYLASTFYNRP